MIKKTTIVRKMYIAPHVTFEDVETEEREYLLAGSPDDVGGGDTGQGEGSDPDPILGGSGLRGMMFEAEEDPYSDFLVNEY